MSLASLVGDDEHTAKDDAYVRAMKCRKWVVVASALCVGVYADLFAPEQFSIYVGTVEIDVGMWRNLAFASLVYTVVQYGLLLAQLAGRYSELLAQRFGIRESEKAIAAQQQQRRLIDELEILEGRSSSALGAAASTAFAASSGGVYGRPSGELLARRIDNLVKQIDRLQEQIDALPTQSKPSISYKACEISIDSMRILFPIFATAIAAGTIARYYCALKAAGS